MIFIYEEGGHMFGLGWMIRKAVDKMLALSIDKGAAKAVDVADILTLGTRSSTALISTASGEDRGEKRGLDWQLPLLVSAKGYSTMRLIHEASRRRLREPLLSNMRSIAL
jgi:hypothetical protein